jgi:uncharacterized protein
MRTSFYNFIIKNEKYNNYLIYNSLKNSLIEAENNIIEYLNSNVFKEYEKYNIDKSGFDTLTEYGIITEQSEDDEKKGAFELDKSKRQIRLNRSETRLSFTIMPTNSCNFRCYYCYESLSKVDSPGMSESTLNDLLKMFAKLLETGIYTHLKVDYYGGEPLLKLPNIIALQKATLELCKMHNVFLDSSIVTNGLLLTQETIALLLEHKILSAQVTLDGSEKTHNKRRRFPENPDKNYETIMENIFNSPENFKINIRINLDKFNEGEQYDLVKDMMLKKIWPYKKNISFYIAHVRDRDNPNKDSLIPMDSFLIEELEFRMWTVIEYNKIIPGNKAKFNFTYPSLFQNAGCGLALSKNSVVIDENGDFFKCWEAVGVDKLKLGCINDILNGVSFSELGKDWITQDANRVTWGCNNCNFMPICSFKCPFEFLHNGKDNYIRCSEWKYSIENSLLFQYNLAKENPQLINGFEIQ